MKSDTDKSIEYIKVESHERIVILDTIEEVVYSVIQNLLRQMFNNHDLIEDMMIAHKADLKEQGGSL